MEQLTFLELAEMILKEEGKPLTSKEIWQIAKNKGYDKNVGTKGKTPWNTIGAKIYVNIRDNKDSPFVIVGSKPKKFSLRNLGIEMIEEVVTEKYEKELKYYESDLHPFLTYFIYHYIKAYLKTICHEKSKKKEYSEWTHPDMVGVYFPFEELSKQVIEFSSALYGSLAKLFSFEIKKELNFSNLRESFFQTVSNSSWANEGYLVSSEIQKDDKFLIELKRLSSSFGIGIIEINIDDPDSSKILFPAKFREYLDWDTINKLSDINDDFREFLTRITRDISNKEIIKERYEKIYTPKELIKMIKNNILRNKLC
ncbi:MAG: HTH domain-containing protein [bacterium]